MQPDKYAEAPLKANSSLCIGYGPTGQLPRAFTLDKVDANVEMGFLKLYVTTSPTDLPSIQQLPIFPNVEKIRPRDFSVSPPKIPDVWAIEGVGLIRRRPHTTTDL